jgi:PPOX class probable F420-dependent enzyme
MFTPEQEAFLDARTWAVLATGRRDGSPQVSMVGFSWDGKQLLVSVKSDTAKWHNAQRQPRVALLVHEDRKQLVIYGRADAIDQDPERAELSLPVFRKVMGKKVPQSEAFVRHLDEQKRTILRIIPEKAFMND